VRSGDLVGGRFRIESLAGSGGMGSVWRALDQESGQRVALKLLHGRDPRDTARFIREAQLIAGLAHPGIVGYVADGQISEAERYLVMEWLDGESLAERLEREPLSLADSLAMGRRAAEALGAMHRHGVVHRDLKPSNLFLEGGEPERVKIIDFGIARRDTGPDVTRAGVLLGTPGYIAPEQALGDPNVDARADVFTLGCVLFRCITGEGAYGTEDDLTILLRIVKGTAQRARDVLPRLPAEIDELLARLLARNPADRPRDAEGVASALARLSTIYGAGHPGDEPLEDLITTRSRAVAEISDETTLGTTSPFPLTVPRSRTFEVLAADADEDAAPLSAADLEDIRTEPGRSDASKAFAASVTRALAAAEAAQRAAPSATPTRAPSATPTRAPSATPTPAAPTAPIATPTPAPSSADDPTVSQLLAAADASLRQNDFRNALAHARRGLDAGARGQLLGALLTRQAEAHRWRGEHEGAERAATFALTSLVPATELWWFAVGEAALTASARADVPKVAALAEEITRHLPGARPDAANVGTLAITATALMHAGHAELLGRFLLWAEPLLSAGEQGAPAMAARFQQIRAVRAVHQGDLGARLEAAEAASERFAAAQDMRSSLVQRVAAAFAKIELGTVTHAEADLRAAVTTAERMGLNSVTVTARAGLAVVLAKRGKPADARTIMLDVLKESISQGDRRLEAYARTHLSLILLASGDEAGAVREAKGAAELTPPNAPSRAFALGALARAQLVHERPMAALEAAEQAMELLEPLGGMEEGEAIVRLAFAEATRQTGDVEGAADAISAARDRLHARAARIKDAAFRQSFLRDVAENAQTRVLHRVWLDESREWTE
jgi:serine/threonine protein kinase